MGFKKRIDTSNGTVAKFENFGDAITGYYIGSFDHDGEYGPTKKHLFQTDKGTSVVFGQTHLTQMLEGIETGIMVRVTFIDEKASKKKNRSPMKLFEVEYDEDLKLDSGDLTAAAAAQSGDSQPEGEEEQEESEEGEESEEQDEAPAEQPAAAPAQRTRAPQPARTATRTAAPASGATANAAPATRAPAARPAASRTVSPEQQARAQALLGGAKK